MEEYMSRDWKGKQDLSHWKKDGSVALSLNDILSQTARSWG